MHARAAGELGESQEAYERCPLWAAPSKAGARQAAYGKNAPHPTKKGGLVPPPYGKVYSAYGYSKRAMHVGSSAKKSTKETEIWSAKYMTDLTAGRSCRFAFRAIWPALHKY